MRLKNDNARAAARALAKALVTPAKRGDTPPCFTQ
jgi:hypothetical protein